MKNQFISILIIVLAITIFNVVYRQLEQSLTHSLLITVIIVFALTVLSNFILVKK